MSSRSVSICLSEGLDDVSGAEVTFGDGSSCRPMMVMMGRRRRRRGGSLIQHLGFRFHILDLLPSILHFPSVTNQQLANMLGGFLKYCCLK